MKESRKGINSAARNSRWAGRYLRPALASVAVTVVLAAAAQAIGAGAARMASSDSAGTPGNQESRYSAISADGRYVAFYSDASNLVAGDTNGKMDAFVKNTLTGEIRRVSTGSGGEQANNTSGDSGGPAYTAPSISADGRYVAFYSNATNLVPGGYGYQDIFVKDTQGCWTAVDGSCPGRIIQASADAAGSLRNLGNSYTPAISADGRYVAFQSAAANLVSGDSNYTYDVYLKDTRDCWTDAGVACPGPLALISTSSSGGLGNSQSGEPRISDDGRRVAFRSLAANLVTGDTNATQDVFVKDTQGCLTGGGFCAGPVTRVSTDSAGGQGNGQSLTPFISADGSLAGFASQASNLVPGDTNGKHDVFVKDIAGGQTTRVSTDSGGIQGNHESYMPTISAGGRYVAFYSSAANLVADDHNSLRDVFVKDTLTGQTCLVSRNTGGAPANGVSLDSAISADGRQVTFYSQASDLVAGDTNGAGDVFTGPQACFACEPGVRPALYLSHESFWATFADYLSREVSVTFTVSNHGPDTAHAAAITGAANTPGATLLSSTPIELGDIAAGAAGVTTVKYYASPGLPWFDTWLTGRAFDSCGSEFAYPPE